MCGRYSLFTPPDDLEGRFDATFDFEFEPRYNAAPSQSLPVIGADDPDTIRRMEWGFVPTWADDRGDFEFINARAETIDEKPTFGDAFEQSGLNNGHSDAEPHSGAEAHNDAEAHTDDGGGDESAGTVTAGRCLVPADGFYEWTETEAGGSGGKRPYRVAFDDDRPFAMAGIWARWTPPQAQTGLDAFGAGTGGGGNSNPEPPATDPEPIETFAIVTTEPNDLIADLHHRMAVILDPSEEETWLGAEGDEAASILDPYPDDDLRAYPVSTAVNDPGNDTPELIEPVG